MHSLQNAFTNPLLGTEEVAVNSECRLRAKLNLHNYLKTMTGAGYFTSTKKATQNWTRAATRIETLHDRMVGMNC